MATQSGRYDHPSYLTRQVLTFGKTTAGANTVQYGGTAGAGIVFPFDVRIRNMVGSVQVAGTSASPGAALIVYCAGTTYQFPGTQIVNNYGTASALSTATATNTTTTTLGYIPTGTATPGSVLQSGDMNFRLPAGQPLILKNGTDATGSLGSVALEYYIDPGSGVWTGGS